VRLPSRFCQRVEGVRDVPGMFPAFDEDDVDLATGTDADTKSAGIDSEWPGGVLLSSESSERSDFPAGGALSAAFVPDSTGSWTSWEMTFFEAPPLKELCIVWLLRSRLWRGPLIQLWSRASSALSRASGCFVSSDRMKVLHRSECWAKVQLTLKSTMHLSVRLSMEAMLGPSKGSLQERMKKSTEPALKQSTFGP